MLNVKTDQRQQFQINNGDMKTLKEVLEKEAGNMKANLVEAANPDTFRFHQGAIQALEGVIRILPQ